MRSVLSVAAREIQERKALLLAALVAGVLPPAAALVPVAGVPLWEVRDVLALLLGVSLPAGVAIGLGASVVASDLAERRLGFYFSRPLSGAAIWGGKLLAALALSLLALVLVLGPVALLEEVWLAERRWPMLFFPGVLAFLVALAHVMSLAYRARDGLLWLDLALLVATVWLFFLVGWRLFESGARETLLLGGMVLLIVLFVLLIAAGAVGVIVGRTDGRRGHLALSATLWGGLLLAAGGSAGFASWVLAVTPADLGVSPYGLVPSPRGDVALLGFTAKHRMGYQPPFLLDLETGRFLKLPGYPWSAVVFSADGRRAAWVEAAGPKGPPAALVLARLDGPGLAVERRPFERGRFQRLRLHALSADGSRVLVRSEERVHVLDSDSTREIVSAPLPRVAQAFFLGPDRVRVVTGWASPRTYPLALFDLSATTGALTEVLRLEAGALFLAADGERALVSRDGELLLWDGRRTLSLLGRAPSGWRGSLDARFLADGRIVALVQAGAEAALKAFGAEGNEQSSIVLPSLEPVALSGWPVRLGGEPVPGEIAVGLNLADLERRETLIVDLASGAVRRRERGLAPAVWNSVWAMGSAGLPLAAGSPASRAFVGPDGTLVLLDPGTGHRRVILPGVSGKP